MKEYINALRTGEDPFLQLARKIRSGIWLSDPARNRTIYISPGCEEIWGCTRAALNDDPRAFLIRIHPEDRERVSVSLEGIARGAFSEIYRVMQSDGTARWVKDWAFPFQDHDKDVRRVVRIVEDISSPWRADVEMRKLSTALEQIADSVIITNSAGEIEYVNESFVALTGYSRDEVCGRKPSIVKSDLHSLVFYKRLWDTIRAGEVFRDILINRKKDGTLYYEEKTITPLKDGRGNITHFVSTGKDITERVQIQERLHHLAYHDALTGLPNRAMFLDRLRHALARRVEGGRRVAVLFLDLDRFKIINDSLGHDHGDSLLKLLAGRIAGCMREGDTVARLGGDEFAVLFEAVNSVEDISPIARKILDALAQCAEVGGSELFVTASIGVSLYPDDGGDAHTLLKQADTAMYRSKAQGGGTYSFYSAEMSARALERLTLESHLHRAIENEEFLLHFQPQVDLGSGRVTGAEALIRWQHPEQGLVSPLEFIPLLEETGLIKPVGEWVLRAACAQAMMWQTDGAPLRIAVNLSGRQFNGELASLVGTILDKTGLDPGALELEITESVLMQHDQTAIENLEALHHLGVRMAIDDFGTGYSSLGYLKRFPIHALKIDRSFVQDLASDSDDAAIVTAIIALSHSLGMEVIAEGVENRDQLRFLRNLECDAMQGYLFSRPLTVPEMDGLLQEGRFLDM